MTNLLRTACEWLSSTRHASISETVIVACPGREGVTLKATQTQASGQITKEGIKVAWKEVTWLFRYSDLVKYKFDARGLVILWNGYRYKAVFTSQGAWDFNDPYQNDVVIKTTFDGEQ